MKIELRAQIDQSSLFFCLKKIYRMQQTKKTTNEMLKENIKKYIFFFFSNLDNKTNLIMILN
jgi:hypothetical protein